MESTTGQSSFLRVSRCLAVVGVVIAGFSGCAAPGTSTPRDWEPISADEASLVLYAPGLGSPRVSFKRRIDGLKVYELGHWRPTVGASSEAKIILFRFKSVAPSSMTFVREPSLEERIRRWLSSENIEMGASGKYRNVLGGMEYARFTRDGATQCVFMRQYGDTYSDQRGYFSDGSTGHGNIMIRGYYCVAPFHPLSQATLERFLAGIGLKGFGVPEKPDDLALPPLSASDQLGLEKSKRLAKEQQMKQKSDKDICDGLRYGHPDYVDEADRRKLSREMCD